MYHYVDDKAFLSRMRNLCGGIMQDLCHTLKKEYGIGAQFYLVGSGKRKLIMQNEKLPIDLDYNLEIVKCDNFNDCRTIKESVRKAFNSVLDSFNLRDCEDSRSSLTTKEIIFTTGNQTAFTIDVCIVARNCNEEYFRLIHEKTGWVSNDRYYWNIAPNSRDIKAKAEYIQEQGKWQMVRDQYEKIKNHYLTWNDQNHPSFICYIEAVNNVYNQRHFWK